MIPTQIKWTTANYRRMRTWDYSFSAINYIQVTGGCLFVLRVSRLDGTAEKRAVKKRLNVGREKSVSRKIHCRTNKRTVHTYIHRTIDRWLIDRLVLLYVVDGWINVECLYISSSPSRTLSFFFSLFILFFLCLLVRASFVFILHIFSLLLFVLDRLSTFSLALWYWSDWLERTQPVWGIKFNRKLFFSRRQAGADKLHFPHVGPVQNRGVWSVI